MPRASLTPPLSSLTPLVRYRSTHIARLLKTCVIPLSTIVTGFTAAELIWSHRSREAPRALKIVRIIDAKGLKLLMHLLELMLLHRHIDSNRLVHVVWQDLLLLLHLGSELADVVVVYHG